MELIRDNVEVESEVMRTLSGIDTTRFTNSTNAVLSLDSVKGVDVVCVDLCYDNSEYLPACDVVNLVQLPLTEECVQFARQVLNNIAEKFHIPVRDELSESFPVCEESLDDKIRVAKRETEPRSHVKASEMDIGR